MNDLEDLLRRIRVCPAGKAGWREFEEACTELLTRLFVPPLQPPRIQARSLSGIDRRDAVFSNRELNSDSRWGQLRHELAARMILVEFKNYGSEEIGKDEVDQAQNYLTEPMGRLAILCCNKTPHDSAFIRRNSIYSREKKVILFLTPNDLQKMCFIKERDDDPADEIVDLVETFYLQHE